MKFLANTSAAAALVLFVASWSATAEPNSPLPGQPRQRNPAKAPAPARSAETPRQQEAAHVANEEEAAGAFSGGAPLWYKMLPAAQGEADKSEGPQNYIPALRDGWEAVSGQVSKINPEQLKEAALAQMRRIRATAAGEDPALKVPAFLQNILNDPEARKSFAQFALGALGMTAAGVALGDAALIRELSLIALYVAALTQFFRGGVQLAGRVATEPGDQDGSPRTKYTVRQLLAKLLGARLPENERGEPGERLDEQD